MTEATNSQRLNFGVKMSALINASKSFGVIGTATVKTSKVLAAAAVLSGGSTEDVSKRTGIAEGTIKRVVALVRNGVPAREGFIALTPEAISTRLHELDWAALTDSDASADDRLDATYAAAAIWDDAFIEVSKPNTRKTADEMTPTNLAILVHDSIVNAANPQLWIDAVSDALASAEAALSEPDEDVEVEAA